MSREKERSENSPSCDLADLKLRVKPSRLNKEGMRDSPTTLGFRIPQLLPPSPFLPTMSHSSRSAHRTTMCVAVHSPPSVSRLYTDQGGHKSPIFLTSPSRNAHCLALLQDSDEEEEEQVRPTSRSPKHKPLQAYSASPELHFRSTRRRLPRPTASSLSNLSSTNLYSSQSCSSAAPSSSGVSRHTKSASTPSSLSSHTTHSTRGYHHPPSSSSLAARNAVSYSHSEKDCLATERLRSSKHRLSKVNPVPQPPSRVEVIARPSSSSSSSSRRNSNSVLHTSKVASSSPTASCSYPSTLGRVWRQDAGESSQSPSTPSSSSPPTHASTCVQRQEDKVSAARPRSPASWNDFSSVMQEARERRFGPLFSDSESDSSPSDEDIAANVGSSLRAEGTGPRARRLRIDRQRWRELTQGSGSGSLSPVSKSSPTATTSSPRAYPCSSSSVQTSRTTTTNVDRASSMNAAASSRIAGGSLTVPVLPLSRSMSPTQSSSSTSSTSTLDGEEEDTAISSLTTAATSLAPSEIKLLYNDTANGKELLDGATDCVDDIGMSVRVSSVNSGIAELEIARALSQDILLADSPFPDTALLPSSSRPSSPCPSSLNTVKRQNTSGNITRTPLDISLSPLVEHILALVAMEYEEEDKRVREEEEAYVKSLEELEKRQASEDGSNKTSWWGWFAKDKDATKAKRPAVKRVTSSPASTSSQTSPKRRRSQSPSPTSLHHPSIRHAHSQPSLHNTETSNKRRTPTTRSSLRERERKKHPHPITIAYGYRAKQIDVQKVFYHSHLQSSLFSTPWEERRRLDDEEEKRRRGSFEWLFASDALADARTRSSSSRSSWRQSSSTSADDDSDEEDEYDDDDDDEDSDSESAALSRDDNFEEEHCCRVPSQDGGRGSGEAVRPRYTAARFVLRI